MSIFWSRTLSVYTTISKVLSFRQYFFASNYSKLECTFLELGSHRLQEVPWGKTSHLFGNYWSQGSCPEPRHPWRTAKQLEISFLITYKIKILEGPYPYN